jgi:hypothetical protein
MKLWHRWQVVAKRALSTGRKRKPAKKTKSRKATRTTHAERLDRLEEWMELLFRASLRGRLLPADRRAIKKVLEERKKENKKKIKDKKEPRCPACRNILADPKVDKCPWCSVLLSEFRKMARKRRRS